MAENCIHGTWQDDECVCFQGFGLGYDERELNPVYCQDEAVTVINLNDYTYYNSEAILAYLAMGLTIAVATWCLVGLCTVFVSIMELFLLGRNIKKVEAELNAFFSEQVKYGSHRLKDAALWNLPENVARCIAVK